MVLDIRELAAILDEIGEIRERITRLESVRELQEWLNLCTAVHSFHRIESPHRLSSLKTYNQNQLLARENTMASFLGCLRGSFERLAITPIKYRKISGRIFQKYHIYFIGDKE